MDTKFVRNAALTAAIAGFISVGAAAQSGMGSDQSSTSSASAGQSGSSQLSPSDKTFIKKAAEGGMAEVELGKLAAEKGSSEDVKKFGQRMVEDHSKANDQLKQVASSKGVEVPADLNAKDKATKARLSKLSGEQFDKAYMSDMVKDHQQDVAEFRKESKMAKDPEVKSFASQTLPVIEDHLKEARSIAPKVGAPTKQSANQGSTTAAQK
jgi:putative membrane protein